LESARAVATEEAAAKKMEGAAKIDIKRCIAQAHERNKTQAFRAGLIRRRLNSGHLG
jgi:hypothetical protein